VWMSVVPLVVCLEIISYKNFYGTIHTHQGA
jgi:hypothetical protein